MTLKRLSDVSVGQVIKIGERKYKLSSTAPFGYLVKKEVLPGIFTEGQVDVSSVVTNYNGAFNTLVEVVEVGNALKSDLTSQLRTQQKKQSLTDSLRAQQAATEEDEDDIDDDYGWGDEDEEEDEDEDEGWYQDTAYGTYVPPAYQQTAPKSFNAHAHSEISAYDAPPVFKAPTYKPLGLFQAQSVQVPGVSEAKASALSANLKAQQAQQTSQQARFDAAIAKAKVAGVQAEVDYLGNAVQSMDYDVASARQAADDVSYQLENFADVAYDAQDAAYEAINRVAAIEQKQSEEEHKVYLQNALNEKLAEQKRQSELQAQLNQKLNQKTTGGNGTMKKLFGAAFNFGKVEGKFAFSPITGGLALRKGLTNDFVAYNKDTKELTDVSGLTLKFDVPAFKLPVAGAAVEVGDLIIHNGEFVYVTKKNDGYLETLNPEKGVNGSVVPTKNALLGATFYTVVKTLDAAGQGGFNPMLLMALNKGGEKQDLLPLLLASGGLGGNGTAGAIDPMMLMLMGDDTEDLLPLVLMQQGGATGAGFNPLMFLLTQKGGKGKDLLPLLLASGGLNGGTQAAGGINPMMMMALAGDGDIDFTTLALMGGLGNGGGLFGQAPVAASVKEVKKDTK